MGPGRAVGGRRIPTGPREGPAALGLGHGEGHEHGEFYGGPNGPGKWEFVDGAEIDGMERAGQIRVGL